MEQDGLGMPSLGAAHTSEQPGKIDETLTSAVIETIQDHLEMIADHGHSHGFEEAFC